MVSVEAALVIPTLLVVLLVAGWGIAGLWASTRCAAAADAAARAVGSGASLSAARSLAVADAPAGASVQLSVSGRLVTVRVSLRRRLFGGVLARLPPLTATATARGWLPASLPSAAGR
jgi:Flp pilus assembly protein TadG